jgi:K+-sensing histidine kinase KdpD
MRLLTLKTVLVAVARDGTSVAAIRAGAALTAATGAALHVVHVTDERDVTPGTLAPTLDGVEARVHVVPGTPPMQSDPLLVG